MFKRFLLSLLLSASFISYANATSEPTTCYAFQNDKLLSKGRCTVDSGMGAGGMWTSINYKGKKHLEEITTEQAQDQSTEYTRNAKNFKRYAKNSQIPSNTPVLLCNIDKPVNLCYFSK